MRTVVLGIVAAMSLSAPAYAVDVTEGSVSLNSTSLFQLGRLSRNSIPQDFSGGEAYPGVINTTTPYAYTSITVPFAANASQDVYYGITFDDVSTDLFASAYLNSYNPANKQTNWLGDAGTSGNYFGTDALFFGVLVPKGNVLTLVVNSATGRTQTSSANYLVQAFSDSEYNEDFTVAVAAPTPEPATWGMMILGFGLAGAALRRRQRVTTRVAYAA